MDKLSKEAGVSPDLLADNIERLREIFPEVFADGHIDFDVLKQTLGEHVDDQDERYSFTWHGKNRARRIAQMPSSGTLLPYPKESVNWDTTKNVFIEGDNLEVLKLLQKSYHRKVKMIYIDPPYNTGNEFIYPDKWQDNLDTYLRYTQQVDDEGFKLSANSETSGRYHTNWLNMMYPRLKLARNLLQDDGVVLVSIDDHEMQNLHRLCDEVFGEENFIATLVWEKGRKNDAKRFSSGHDYIVIFAKDLSLIESITAPWREPKEGVAEIVAEYEELRRRHANDNDVISKGLIDFYRKLPKGHPSKKYSRSRFVDQRGIWRDNNISWPGGGGPRYDLPHPTTGKPCKVPDDGWRFVERTMLEKVAAGYVDFRKDHTESPFLKSYLYIDPARQQSSDVDNVGEKLQVMGSVFYRHTQPANEVIKELFGEKIFENPKDHTIIGRLVRYICGSNDIVLDFFAGSGTTAHAVLEMNKMMDTSLRFILVQLPEPTSSTDEGGQRKETLASSAGFQSIADVCRERIRRAAKKIQAEDAVDLDGGFRSFKLASSNIIPWDADFDSMATDLIAAVDNIKADRSEDDVLYELLLKYGLDLSISAETRDIESSKVNIIGAGALVVCLADNISLEVVSGIAALKEELKPEIMRVVFKDAGFADDVTKTNANQILRQAGIEDVKSL